MPDHEPTLGEVYRLLLAMQQTMDRMSAAADRDRAEAASTFARKDVLDRTLDGINRRFDDVEKDVEDGKKAMAAQQSHNRQYVLALIGIAGTALVSILMWILTGTQGVVG